MKFKLLQVAALSLGTVSVASAAEKKTTTKESKTYVSCIEAKENTSGWNEGFLLKSGCDSKRSNQFFNRGNTNNLDKNGCTKTQLAVVTTKPIASCPVPVEL